MQTKCSLPENTVNTIFYAHIAFAIISFHIFTCYIVHKSVNFDLPNSVNMFAFLLVVSQHLKENRMLFQHVPLERSNLAISTKQSSTISRRLPTLQKHPIRAVKKRPWCLLAGHHLRVVPALRHRGLKHRLVKIGIPRFFFTNLVWPKKSTSQPTSVKMLFFFFGRVFFLNSFIV